MCEKINKCRKNVNITQKSKLIVSGLDVPSIVQIEEMHMDTEKHNDHSQSSETHDARGYFFVLS